MGGLKLAFHNNRFIAVEKKKDGIYLARKIRNELHIDYLKKNTITFNKFKTISCLTEEFDINIDLENNLNILYINDNNDIILSKQKGKEKLRAIKSGLDSRIYYLTMVSNQDTDNVFYMQDTENKNIFRIYHLFLKDNIIKEFMVDEIETYEILNSFKVLKDGDNLLILYYYRNQICLKGFDIKKSQWSHSITLTNNKNRLYLDAMKIGNILHLVYCDFDLENFTIKYEGFIFDNDYINRINEKSISPKGNFTDPVFVMVGDKIWICWRDTNKLLSIYSTDNGYSWNDIYQWNEVKRLDIVKYKYVTDIIDNRVYIENVYGTTGKDIGFVGFGNIKNAEILDRKISD
jgi:hypothetical protein